jgi:hypothetical protein
MHRTKSWSGAELSSVTNHRPGRWHQYAPVTNGRGSLDETYMVSLGFDDPDADTYGVGDKARGTYSANHRNAICVVFRSDNF